jgi:hypothetical protein
VVVKTVVVKPEAVALLLSAVEFEDAVEVDLGDPMVDGCRRSLRAVLFLVFAVT